MLLFSFSITSENPKSCVVIKIEVEMSHGNFIYDTDSNSWKKIIAIVMSYRQTKDRLILEKYATVFMLHI